MGILIEFETFSNIVMENPHSSNPDKLYYATQYHMQLKPNENNYFLYGYMRGLGISSAFEFGCNAGRHLQMLTQYGIPAAGIDINHEAIKYGRKMLRVNCCLGDEETLRDMQANIYDACFTVSVLSHIKEISEILADLERIATRYVILCETEEKRDAEKHWYSHQYPKYGYKVITRYRADELDCHYQLYVKRVEAQEEKCE